MTKEARKHRTCISYAFMHDRLNNPVRIQFTDGSVTKYIYSAAGEKLRVTHLTAVPNISVAIGSTRELLPSEILSADSVDYLLGGSLTLRNGRIDKLQFDEGYCQATAYSGNASQDNFTFLYYDRDHLGSIRQVIKATGNNKGVLLQSMDYYPFGAQFCDGSTASEVQSRKYNGKELDKMHGLNTYDYGARQYNPVLGRWDRVDPLCEKYYDVSPYVYCHNNPIKLLDPDGRQVWDGLGSYNEDNKDLKLLTKYLASHDDPNSIMIVAHGVVKKGENMASSINIQTYNPKTKEWSDNYISTGEELSKFLSQNSKVWKNYKKGKIGAKDLHIVFYSCSSSEVVEKISSYSEFKDITFIAPNKDIGVGEQSQVFVADMKETPDGRFVIDNSPGRGPGNWVTIRNGSQPRYNSQYPGSRDLKPGTANFEYKHTFF
jgi:RHS repeat-associated protein